MRSSPVSDVTSSGPIESFWMSPPLSPKTSPLKIDSSARSSPLREPSATSPPCRPATSPLPTLSRPMSAPVKVPSRTSTVRRLLSITSAEPILPAA